MTQHPTLTLRKNLSQAIRAGHPWLFADALAVPAGLTTGQTVDIADRQGRFVARGLFDAGSPLAVRVWTLDPAEGVDGDLIRRRVGAARDLRRAVIDARTTDAYRLLHGEGDRLPGVVCDVYADTAVIQLDSLALEPRLDDLTRAILDATAGLRRVVLRPRGRPSGDWGAAPRSLAGPPLEGPLIIHEHGLCFEVDVARGHKTGFYLDQRENRRRIRALAAGRRVLNLFAFTGGFSVAAAAGGAVAVTSVDISRPAIDAARRNVALNGWEAEVQGPDWEDPGGRDAGAPGFRFAAADAFAFLKECPDLFDLVVVDPPSMAPSKAALATALASYRKLNALALVRVAPGGLLFTASCSSHVTAEQLREAVGAAAVDARRDVRILESGGAGPDHPTLPGFAEGRYLKTLLLFVV